MSAGNFQKIKLERKVKVVIPHDIEINERLESARKIIEYVYENNHCSVKTAKLPAELQNCGLAQATQSGILWYTARRNRPKVLPDPFLVIYGKTTAFYPKENLVICINEGNLKLPAPVGFPPDTRLRWLVIRKDTITYYLRGEVEVGFEPHQGDGDEEEELEAKKPFNINQIPNLGITNTDTCFQSY